ncbi:hypothetical protein K438DRAFT_1852325 [Mycena galopus ATCC 62051]|nr:hypothetical protein K438DRAFT_1852325 [Mycena galopus ATCC 62051]
MIRPRNREAKSGASRRARVVRNHGKAARSRESRKATSSRMGRVENKTHRSRVEGGQNGRVESSETGQKGRVKVGAD